MHTQLYGLGVSENIQFMMDSSGCMEIWWPLWLMLLLRPNSRPRAIFQKENGFLQCTAGLCSRILRACTVIHLQRPIKISKHQPCQPLLPHLPLHLLGYVAQVTELAQLPGPVVEPFLIPSPLKTRSFLGSGKCTRVTYPNKEYIASKIQKAHPVFCLFFVCLRQIQQLTFQFLMSISIYSMHLDP